MSNESENFPMLKACSTTMFEVSSLIGETKIRKILEAPKQAILSSNESYVLDTNSGVFEWQGKRTSSETRKHAMTYAQGLLASRVHPRIKLVHLLTWYTWYTLPTWYTFILNTYLGVFVWKGKIISSEKESMFHLCSKFACLRVRP